MALDSTGRPIPVSTPDPPDYEGSPTAEQRQFMLISQRTDDTLTLVEDLSRRVAALEEGGEERLNAKLADFEQRFDTKLLNSLTDHETRFQVMAETLRAFMERYPPPPPPPLMPSQ
jgi:hypothetical protein